MMKIRGPRPVVGATLLLAFSLPLVLARPAVAAAPLSHQAGALALCQDSIREASVRLGDRVWRRFGACATRGVECLLATDGRDACCLRAADRCARDLEKLDRDVARFERHVIGRRCAGIPFIDLIDPDGLGYGATLDACERLIPPVVVADLPDLVLCLRRLVAEDAAHLIATIDVPRTCEGLSCMGVETELAAACAGDPASCDGGIRVTPTLTLAPATTPSPSATATPLPSASVTTTPTAAPSAPTATSTPLPTTTATSTALPTTTTTATSTPLPTPTTTATTTVLPTVAATMTAIPTAGPTVTSTATADPTATPTPLLSGTTTATPVPTASATTTPVPTTTVTMTAQPTATVTPTPTLTPTLTATPTVTPTPTGPVCGDGTKDAGEDCDDGNTFDCDSCPADCSFAVAACPTGTESQTVSVRVTPQFSGITGADLCLSYPDGTVQIPGTGLVSGRTTFNGLLFLNDSDVAAQLSASTTTVMSTLDMTVRFDLCMGSAPAPLGLFHCQIRNASDDFNQLIPLTDVSCQVQ